MILRCVLLSIGLLALGCEKPVDADALLAKLAAAKDRTCACKDVACLKDAQGEFGKLWSENGKVKKDRDLTSKFAALQVEHNACVQSAMKAQGYK